MNRFGAICVSTDGFLLIDKPRQWTSHDVVAKIRSLARLKKVGHAGTLDPMATGLLVLGLGKATRLLRFVQSFPKEYVATARFGVGTDSLDADGEVTERISMSVTAGDLAASLAKFRGSIRQTPPMKSAVRVGGRRLYEIAREGDEVERPSREVEIHELELIDFVPGEFPEVGLRVVCSSGTYIRTLADDIARTLGGPGHLTALRRTRNGSLDLADATSIDQLAEDPDSLWQRVLSPAAGLSDLGAVMIDDALAERVAHGAVLDPTEVAIADTTALVDGAGRLLAVYRQDGDRLKPEVVLS